MMPRLSSLANKAASSFWRGPSFLVEIFFSVVRVYFGVYHSFRILIGLACLLFIHWFGLGLAPCKRLWLLVFGNAKARQILALYTAMERAQSYQEWYVLAQQLDELAGGRDWRHDESDGLCDFKGLRSHCQALHAAREGRDFTEMLFLLRVSASRNFCDLRNPELYSFAYTYTKDVVEDFYREVSLTLDALAEGMECREKVFAKIPASPPLLRKDVSRLSSFEEPRTARNVATPQLQAFHDLVSSLRLAVGRTALCLSGGGGLAISHIGVIKMLIEQGMMPRVISGSSGGALVAGLLALNSDEDFVRNFCQPNFLQVRQVALCPPFTKQIRSLLHRGHCLDPDDFAQLARTLFGEATFADAFQKTGRFVSITTTPAGTSTVTGEPLVCNCINTPDVLIWSAVVASCSLPLILPPSKLYTRSRPPSSGMPIDPDTAFVRQRRNSFTSAAGSDMSKSTPRPERETLLHDSSKNHDLLKAEDEAVRRERVEGERFVDKSPSKCENGQKVHDEGVCLYAPASMNFVDGSILQDIPHTELRTLFSVKSFIVSQVNPHFTPFIHDPYRQRLHHGKSNRRSIVAKAIHHLWSYIALDIRNRYGRLLFLSFVPKIRGQDVSPFLMQQAEGHITIVPALPQDFWRLTANPSPSHVKKAIRIGEQRTWPHITRLRHTFEIETKLRNLWVRVSFAAGCESAEIPTSMVTHSTAEMALWKIKTLPIYQKRSPASSGSEDEIAPRNYR